MRRLFLIAALFLWTPAGAQNDDATPRKIEKETFVYAVRDADTLRLDRYALLSPDSRAKPCLMFLFGGGIVRVFRGQMLDGCHTVHQPFLRLSAESS